MKNIQNKYMNLALLEAKKCLKINEVPVGSLIVHEPTKQIIAISKNEVLKQKDPTSHAEILSIRKAAKFLNSTHLDDCILFSTLEPCPMCQGAILNARIKTLYFGAYDQKYQHLNNLLYQPKIFNINVYGGICEKQSKEILCTYFKTKRNKTDTLEDTKSNREINITN